jgi:ADP-dependent NAD(P)H-hydrate dehydratase / NAD(P)H-hydrate epimerase
VTAPVIGRPALRGPDAGSNKYTRGKVVVIAGAMPGAALLAATAAQRAGAGYVELLGATEAGPPHALVRRPWAVEALDDGRIGAVVIGPGLGRDAAAGQRLEAALGTPHPLVIDADALTLLGGNGAARLRGRPRPVLLTPHEGEFAHVFGPVGADRAAAVSRAAAVAGQIVVLKGSESIVASADGRMALAPPASPWLASAGTGDVLSGIAAAMLAQAAAHGLDAFGAMSAALWLHGEAARRAGPCLIADDLVTHLPGAVAACL